MSSVADALRQKFKSAEDALEALGLDADLLRSPISQQSGIRRGDDMPQFHRARRMGRDEETEFEELQSDPDVGFADLLAGAIVAAVSDPDKAQEVHEALTELGQDRRGPASWARDRLERRRLSRDAR